MPQLDARKAGSFRIGGEIEIDRLGFGAMRITGPRVGVHLLADGRARSTLKEPCRARDDRSSTAPDPRPEVSDSSSASSLLLMTACSSQRRAD